MLQGEGGRGGNATRRGKYVLSRGGGLIGIRTRSQVSV